MNFVIDYLSICEIKRLSNDPLVFSFSEASPLKSRFSLTSFSSTSRTISPMYFPPMIFSNLEKGRYSLVTCSRSSGQVDKKGGGKQMHQHPQGMEIIYTCIIEKVKYVTVSDEILAVCLNKIHSCSKIDCLTTEVIFSEQKGKQPLSLFA